MGNLRLGTRSTLSRWGPNSPLPPAPSHPPPLTVPPRSLWTTSLPHTIVPTHTLGSFPNHFRETLPVKETLSALCPFFLTPPAFPLPMVPACSVSSMTWRASTRLPRRWSCRLRWSGQRRSRGSHAGHASSHPWHKDQRGNASRHLQVGHTIWVRSTGAGGATLDMPAAAHGIKSRGGCQQAYGGPEGSLSRKSISGFALTSKAAAAGTPTSCNVCTLEALCIM